MHIVGLTGGVGSGKSTVTALFAARGAQVVDTDELAREVVTVGSPGLSAVVDRFGPSVLLPDGALDRRALAAIVFASDEARSALNSILHPLVRAAANSRLDQLAAVERAAVAPPTEPSCQPNAPAAPAPAPAPAPATGSSLPTEPCQPAADHPADSSSGIDFSGLTPGAEPTTDSEVAGNTNASVRRPTDGSPATTTRAEYPRAESLALLVVPLMVESGHYSYDMLVTVDCDEDVAVDRLMSSRGWTAEHARSRIAAQASRPERLAAADYVITNNGSLEELTAEVDALWPHLFK